MQLPRGATLWWSRYQTRKNEILSTYWHETQIFFLLAWKPLKNFMCLKVFNKLGHCSSLYHGGYSFSDVLKWLIVSLVFYSKDNDVLLLLLWFTWSIKCLSCTSSSLRSLLWRWAFNLVKNSFCLLMSVAKIKEPSCCSISCLHPQEWKRKHTHKANPAREYVVFLLPKGSWRGKAVVTTERKSINPSRWSSQQMTRRVETTQCATGYF